MRRLVLLTLAIVFSGVMMAQQEGPAISWEKTVHDFGTFNEADGIQTAIFEFPCMQTAAKKALPLLSKRKRITVLATVV